MLSSGLEVRLTGGDGELARSDEVTVTVSPEPNEAPVVDAGADQAVTLPDKSDMEYGRVLWHIVQQGDFTVINYHADVVPAFFVPPLLGPYLLKGRMLEEAQKTIEGIERLVRINDDR